MSEIMKRMNHWLRTFFFLQDEQGIPHLSQQIAVLHFLSRLHYPDNSCLNLKLPVIIQSLSRVLPVVI